MVLAAKQQRPSMGRAGKVVVVLLLSRCGRNVRCGDNEQPNEWLLVQGVGGTGELRTPSVVVFGLKATLLTSLCNAWGVHGNLVGITSAKSLLFTLAPTLELAAGVATCACYVVEHTPR
jgi:hypothetical protein